MFKNISNSLVHDDTSIKDMNTCDIEYSETTKDFYCFRQINIEIKIAYA